MSNLQHDSLTNTLTHFNINISEQDKALFAHCNELVNDTRKLQENDVFCAIIGEHQDGREYIEQAVKSGITMVLSECVKAQQHGELIRTRIANKSVVIIQFYQLNQQLFNLCQRYYQQPQQSFSVIGVTGTNGKTSTCQIVAKLLEANEESCAIMGTLGVGKVDKLTALTNTTPGATELHHYLAQFNRNGEQNLAMEVSSHALSQRRISSNIIDIAIFTNLSRDHLDYHQTMAAYSAAKKTIFSGNVAQIAVLNNDDEQTQEWLNDWQQQPYFLYARVNTEVAKQHSHYVVAENIQHHATGVSFELHTHLGHQYINSPLLGDFNIDNLLAAISVLIIKNKSLAMIAKAVTQLTAIAGRMEAFCAASKPTAVVDYAHTPDALENALLACKEHCRGELWVVFGCGGDRDKGKRAIMGAVAEQNAQHLIITNDNPRSEAPELIATDILAGCQKPEKTIVMLDRKQAVLTTLAKAKADDVVLLAGKGHENNIIIADKIIAYSERATVAEFYAAVHQTDLQNNNNPNEARL